MNPLISTHELAALLGAPDVKVLDVRWRLDGSDMRPAFLDGHLPGAAFFGIDAISDRASPLPHMLPSREAFAAAAGGLGLSETDRIVVYDDGVFRPAARVWWTLRVFGAHRISVLDGGLSKWIAEGHPLEQGAAVPRPARFKWSYPRRPCSQLRRDARSDRGRGRPCH